MGQFFQTIQNDFRVNLKSGIVCVLFLFLYRVGRGLRCFRDKCRRPGRWFVSGAILLIRVLMKPFKFLYGCYIPLSAKIGERVEFRHAFFGVFISAFTEIGNNVVILHQVTIGSDSHANCFPASPRIEDNVFIGCGAKIIGKIVVGQGARVGANCIVVEDVPALATVVSMKPRVILREGKEDQPL